MNRHMINAEDAYTFLKQKKSLCCNFSIIAVQRGQL